MLDNLKVRSKMLISLVVAVGFMLLIGLVGLFGLKSQQSHVNVFFNENYPARTAILGYLNKVEAARAALITMLATGNKAKIDVLDGYVAGKGSDIATLKLSVAGAKADPAKLDPLKERIAVTTREAAEFLDSIINSPYSDEGMKKQAAEIKEVWSAFVKTRDGELIPLIYEGRIDEANKIGLGIQAERYKKFTSLAQAFNESEGKEADAAMKAIAASEKKIVIGLITVVVIAVLFGTVLILVIDGNISGRIGHVLAASESMSNGYLGKQVDVSGKDEIGKLAASFNSMSQNIRDVISDISQAADQIASASEELSSTAEQMSRGMQIQTTQTSQIASAMEEMSATVLEVAKNAQGATSSAKEATSTAQKGGDVVDKTVNGMQRIAATVQESARTIGELGKSSDQIGEIVTVIYDIADQTNLLALNAAIEAARAGEQGRGFAVVADEVRKLAERTTKATKEIANMIKSIQKGTEGAVSAMEAGTRQVNEGVDLASQAGEALQNIIGAVDMVNDMINQIATATREQSAAAEEISTSIEGIASVTKEAASGSQQTTAAGQDLARMATKLQGMVKQFKV